MKKRVKLIIILVIVLSLSGGCSFFGKKEKAKWRPVKQKQQVFIHVVTWNDETYEIIAKWYTGKKHNVESIINANPTLNPDRLQVGDNVFIPRKILRTRKKFTQKYVEGFYKKPVKKIKKKYRPPVEKTEKKSEDFQLFGPR